jgi:DNA recombination protein RmuC
MSTTLPWLTLLAMVLLAILVVVLLVRVSIHFEGARKELRDELRASREEGRSSGKELRDEVSAGLRLTNDTLAKTLETVGRNQRMHLEDMTKELKELTASNQDALDRVRDTFDARLKDLQDGNENKLDEIRKTVDEKLHDTLEKRLGESFRLVSDRLDAVHKGLGEPRICTGLRV